MKTQNLKIIVVDDQESILKGLSQCLKNENYQVVSYAKSKDASLIIQEEYFDILISDLKMPEMSGLTLAEIYRKKNPNGTIFLISAYIELSDALRAIQLKIEDFFHKPFSNDDLVKKIKKISKKNREIIQHTKNRTKNGHSVCLFPDLSVMIDHKRVNELFDFKKYLRYSSTNTTDVMIKKYHFLHYKRKDLHEIMFAFVFSDDNQKINYLRGLMTALKNKNLFHDVVKTIVDEGYLNELNSGDIILFLIFDERNKTVHLTEYHHYGKNDFSMNTNTQEAHFQGQSLMIDFEEQEQFLEFKIQSSIKNEQVLNISENDQNSLITFNRKQSSDQNYRWTQSVDPDLKLKKLIEQNDRVFNYFNVSLEKKFEIMSTITEMIGCLKKNKTSLELDYYLIPHQSIVLKITSKDMDLKNFDKESHQFTLLNEDRGLGEQSNKKLMRQFKFDDCSQTLKYEVLL